MSLTSESHNKVRSGNGRVRILVVGDCDKARDEIRAMLDHDDGIEVVGEVANSLEAVQKVQELAPDAVHLCMPILDTLGVMNGICSQNPAVRVVCTFHGDSGPSQKMWIFKSVSRQATESQVPLFSSL